MLATLFPVVLLLILVQTGMAWNLSKNQVRRFTRKCPLRKAISDDADYLKQKAERLRQEIAVFEETKSHLGREKAEQLEQERLAREALRDRYAATLPVLKPDGSTSNERVDFPPHHQDGASFILTCQARLPLGLVLGESELFAGAIVVDEVAEDGNGGQAGVQVGDIVRAFTACRMQMEQPMWQLMAGGIGRPKMFRYIHPVGVERQVSFEMHLEALASNRLDPENRPVILVLERRQTCK